MGVRTMNNDIKIQVLPWRIQGESIAVVPTAYYAD